ncbi:MAG: alpha/beta hydrolase, partial [Acidobacteriota bacterium]
SFLGTAQAQEFLDFCAAWPAPKRERLADFTPVKTAVPVLLLSGALDPVTPPSSAEQAAAGFARSRHLVVESGGHIVGGLGCLPERIASFIETRDPESLDASCLEGISLPAFFTSEMGP